MTEKLNISEVLSFSWKKVRENFWFFVGLSVFNFIVSQMTTYSDESHPELLLVYLAIEIIFSIIYLLISIGIIKISLNTVDGKKPSLDDLFSQTRLVFRFLSIKILTFLIVFAGIFIPIIPGIVWAIKVGKKKLKENIWYFVGLLLIPWIIWAIQYQFAPFFVIDKKYDPKKALKASAKITDKMKIFLLALNFSLLGVIIIGVLCLFVGIIVAIPVTWIAEAYVYRKLANVRSS